MTIDAHESTPAEKETESGVPRPIARALVAAFVAILLLVILSQGLATWNAGTLSRTVAAAAAEESGIRDLTLALFEIEDANTMLRDWLLTFESERFDPAEYSLHLSNAAESLRRLDRLPERHRETYDAIAAALEDLKTRTLLAYPAVEERNLKAASAIAMDRRAIGGAFHRLRTAIREHRLQAESLRDAAARQSRRLDLSLALISIAMILTAMLLAFLWKRLLLLH